MHTSQRTFRPRVTQITPPASVAEVLVATPPGSGSQQEGGSPMPSSDQKRYEERNRDGFQTLSGTLEDLENTCLTVFQVLRRASPQNSRRKSLSRPLMCNMAAHSIRLLLLIIPDVDPQKLTAALAKFPPAPQQELDTRAVVDGPQHEPTNRQESDSDRGSVQQPASQRPPLHQPLPNTYGDIAGASDGAMGAPDTSFFPQRQTWGNPPGGNVYHHFPPGHEVGLPSDRGSIQQPTSQRPPPHQPLPNTYVGDITSVSGSTISAPNTIFIPQSQTWGHPPDGNVNRRFPPGHHRNPHPVHMNTTNLNLREQASLQTFPQTPFSYPNPMLLSPSMPPLAFSYGQSDNSGGMVYPDRAPSINETATYPDPSTAMLPPYPHQFSHLEEVSHVASPDSIQSYTYFPTPTQATPTQGILHPQPHQSSDRQFVESKGTFRSQSFLPDQRGT